jgi:serine phosphatase RsbU (regulator of sigma subunit)
LVSQVLARSRGLAPEALASACLADLAGHLSGSLKVDDLTLMVIRRAA